MSKVRVAIVGCGNCANSFMQGLCYYSGLKNTASVGLIRPQIGPYRVDDIEVVAAFDVAASKVGHQIWDAIWAKPNSTYIFDESLPIPTWGLNKLIEVHRGPTLDGLGKYLKELVPESEEPPCDVVEELKEAKVDVVINYLPVGSQKATEYYAQAAIEAGCAFVNCIPVFIASNPWWASAFHQAKLPIIGDDIKSQVGATIVHRTLAQLFRDRGVHLDRTYQLNVGGNGDFMNMLERERLQSKKISKTGAVISVAGPGVLDEHNTQIGPSDYIEWLGDRKVALIRMEGRGFGGAPLSLRLELEVWDSPNSAGIVIDAVRCAKLAMDRGDRGPLKPPSACFMKTPPEQIDDDQGLDHLEIWLEDSLATEFV